MDSLKTEDFILGFQDESSPQTIANTVRKWCPEKPRMIKNTNKIKANSMGFYAIRGRSVIEFPQRSKTDDMCMFLESVRRWNDDRPIVMITDNCSIHHSKKVLATAKTLDIHLVFLPPYSPQFNPIEFIWKTLKRLVSKTFYPDRDHMTRDLEEAFMEAASSRSYAEGWIPVFYPKLL